MDLKTATQYANEFMQLIAAGCDHIQIAGSIRRQKAEVKDIEIVAVERKFDVLGYDFFGNRTPETDTHYSHLKDVLHKLVGDKFDYDPKLKRDGDKYKRFVYRGMAVDLFIAEPDNLGNILAIRTGNAEFSRALVTQRNQGGLMPSWLRQKDGYLWNGNSRLICKTEAGFFDAIGIPFVEARDRNETTVNEIKRGFRQ